MRIFCGQWAQAIFNHADCNKIAESNTENQKNFAIQEKKAKIGGFFKDLAQHKMLSGCRDILTLLDLKNSVHSPVDLGNSNGQL